MNDGLLRVNFGGPGPGRRRHPESGERLESQLGQLEADAGPLVATWEGKAQEAYAERQQKWTTASTDLKGSSGTSRARSTSPRRTTRRPRATRKSASSERCAARDGPRRGQVPAVASFPTARAVPCATLGG